MMTVVDDFKKNNSSSALSHILSNDGKLAWRYPSLAERLKNESIRLSLFSILTRDIDIAILSVYSVRDVPVSDKNGLTYRHSF